MRDKVSGYKCPECKSMDIYRVAFMGPSRLICNDCDWWFPGFGEIPRGFDKPDPIILDED